jgi:hypothetical protein
MRQCGLPTYAVENAVLHIHAESEYQLVEGDLQLYRSSVTSLKTTASHSSPCASKRFYMAAHYRHHAPRSTAISRGPRCTPIPPFAASSSCLNSRLTSNALICQLLMATVRDFRAANPDVKYAAFVDTPLGKQWLKIDRPPAQLSQKFGNLKSRPPKK